MLKTKELSCGDRKASSHGERKEGKRGEEGGSRHETKPTKTLKTQMIEKSEQRGGRRETQPRKSQKQTIHILRKCQNSTNPWIQK